jgi:hypothetical protein
MTAIVLALAFLAITMRFLRRARVHGSMVPMNNAHALWRWDQRFDAEFPKESEVRLTLQAKGSRVKRRILAHCRNAAEIRAREDAKRGRAPQDLIELCERIGSGPWVVRQIPVAPLRLPANEPSELNIVVRRPRLSLAR